MSMAAGFHPDTAAGSQLAACEVCEMLTPVDQHQHCHFCRQPIHLRKPASIQKTLAYLMAAIMFYIPANLFPIMITEQLGREEGHTIAGGVWIFWESGAYPIAIVIFVASLFIPVLKMLALLWLCWCTANPSGWHQKHVVRIYRVTQIIGKWSMVDVFVVALMVAVVQLGTIMSVMPGPGATAFAAVVIFTMLSAHAFDIRLIWDRKA